MPYTSVFGNQPVYSADPQLLALALTANVVLEWPLETSEGSLILATIMDVTPNAAGLTITMPDARNGSPGAAITFSNLGADIFTVLDAAVNTVLTVASGESWTIYLRTNTTLAGTWRSFQQGAGTSTANAASLAGAGLKAISTTLNTKFQVSAHAVNYVAVDADRATILEWTGGVGSFTLPDPTVVGSDWYVGVKNAGSGSLTMTPFAATTIDGSGSLILATGESAFFYTDGANFFTMGLGQEINSVFDFISINVAGGAGDTVLAGAQLNRVAYRFTGALTGNRGIVVPASVQQYWVDNETTGAFTLTIKASGGDPGKILAQNNRNIFFCDGTNVLDAVSSAFTPPLAIASGGTGATTAAGARTALGSTTLGDDLFTALSASAARADLGIKNVLSVLKTANEPRSSTVTLNNDGQLALLLDAGKTYAFEILLKWNQGGSTANGIRVVPTGAGTASVTAWASVGTTNTSAGNAAPTSNALGLGGQHIQTLGTAGLEEFIMISGTVVAGAAGSLQCQWAQSVSNATATSVMANSWMKATELN